MSAEISVWGQGSLLGGVVAAQQLGCIVSGGPTQEERGEGGMGDEEIEERGEGRGEERAGIGSKVTMSGVI